jgi:hypothetical protein
LLRELLDGGLYCRAAVGEYTELQLMLEQVLVPESWREYVVARSVQVSERANALLAPMLSQQQLLAATDDDAD